MMNKHLITLTTCKGTRLCVDRRSIVQIQEQTDGTCKIGVTTKVGGQFASSFFSVQNSFDELVELSGDATPEEEHPE